MHSDLWNKVIETLRPQFNDHQFKTWIDPVKTRQIDEGTIEVIVPNRFFEEWITDHYLDFIKEELIRLTNRTIEIRFLEGEELREEPSQTLFSISSHQPTPGKGSSSKIGPSSSAYAEQLNPKYIFDNFVVGSSNQFAHAATYAVAEQPGTAYNPLFIFGGVGLGKTHLLNAIGNHILRKNPKSRIFYLSSEKFMNELINCIRYEKMDQFRVKYRDHIDVLLMADIQPPEMETRVAILKSKAELDDIYLPDDVAIFLASNIKSNIRELEGSLIRIGAFASLTGMEISVDLAKEVIKNVIQQKPVSISLDDIQKNVATFYNVKVIDLKSKKKIKVLSHPRQVAMYLCRKYTQKSFPEIGKTFGGKDHSTVMHAVRKISQMAQEDPVFKKDLDSIEKIVESQNC